MVDLGSNENGIAFYYLVWGAGRPPKCNAPEGATLCRFILRVEDWFWAWAMFPKEDRSALWV